ncbi:MAG: PEP/pyruvate-binding domain-containing protein [Paludibacteraceae bacterium]|nr:PEP/pyruvate-binding domain-containing protein [Paludibacteraceae bacterium]
MNSNGSIKKLYFKDTSFASLMTQRIYNILLIASKYDAFTLEEDGRIDEQIFNEYTSLNLRYPPRFTLASTLEEASELIKTRSFDLFIMMPAVENSAVFEYAKQLKELFPIVPVVLLTPFSSEVFHRLYQNKDFSGIDYVFSWLGETDLLLAIVKLIEDKLNVDEDIASVGVQIILFVENSIQFYSAILPYLYKHVFVQSRSFMTEALNEHEQMLRMRGRPKILLARNYEEAKDLYDKYKRNILGVVSDVRFEREGEIDATAGLKLASYMRSQDRFLPIILESSEEVNREASKQLAAVFINKNSKTMHLELKEAVTTTFGFGEFHFVDPDTKWVVAVIKNLKDLQNKIFDIPSESMFYHLSRNHLSRWLYSRAMFPLAEFLRDLSVERIEDVDAARKIIFDAIVAYRKIKNQGVVAVFMSDRYDSYSNFARIGEGSMGGKGRGLAFLDLVSKRNQEFFDFETTQIVIPKTVVLCVDKFDEFMEQNQLYGIAMSDNASDEEILQHFLRAKLPRSVIADLYAYLKAVDSPIAIRSSSLLEDAHYQPFAGVYSTYMVPNFKGHRITTLMMVCEAIKAVYASVYYRSSKSYMKATKNVISREKMAVVLQEVCGKQYGNRFYPSFSGVGRSLNFYPIGNEKPEDGIVNVALGLGKYIVDGGQTLRFSPKHPHNILQTSTLEFALNETQTHFNALDLSKTTFSPQVDDGFNLFRLPVREAEADGTLRFVASTFDPYDQIIRDGLYEEKFRRVITFANILEHDVFPLADIVDKVLKVGEREMGRPVEIEFAVNLDYENNQNNVFYLLQIRPIVDANKSIDEDLSSIPLEETLITSRQALGNGIIDGIYDVVYVKEGMFGPSNNQLIAYDIDKINRGLMDQDRPYVLIGPGRWGSSDTWLGIPVKWPNIAGAKVIVEAGQTSYHIDPSQGTHFFQNLTSCGSAYLTVDGVDERECCNQDFLESLPVICETKYIKHVRLEKPLVAKIDGKKGLGVVMKSV